MSDNSDDSTRNDDQQKESSGRMNSEIRTRRYRGRHGFETLRPVLIYATVALLFRGQRSTPASHQPSWSSFVLAEALSSASTKTTTTSKTTPIPPPPPISLPVWSLATETTGSASDHNATTTDTANMNIMTFVTPVTVATPPPKRWVLSLYKTTQSYANLQRNKRGILQLLHPSQSKLVPLLGKRSGNEKGFSKQLECERLGEEWITCNINEDNAIDNGLEAQKRLLLLPNCPVYLEMEVEEWWAIDDGDHDVVLCRVVQTLQWDDIHKRIVTSKVGDVPIPLDPSTALYTQQLREEGIL